MLRLRTTDVAVDGTKVAGVVPVGGIKVTSGPPTSPMKRGFHWCPLEE